MLRAQSGVTEVITQPQWWFERDAKQRGNRSMDVCHCSLLSLL